MRLLPRSSSGLAIALCTIVTVAVSVNGWRTALDGEGWRSLVRSDAKGYYGHLTAILLRHDLGREPFAPEYVQYTPTGTLNKYFCGTAVMMAPWFCAGHALALLDPSAPRDGYSEYEMKALCVGGWVHLLIGLLALRSVLRRLGVREGIAAWLLAVLGLGTPLLQYTALQPGWSHVHSFCCISLFLLAVQRFARQHHALWAILAAVLAGLIVLIRPVNGLVLLAIPIVLGSDTLPTLVRLLQRWWVLLAALAAGIAVIALQPIVWHAQTGRWFEWGYRNEGFYWGRPMVFEVLFGIRRGLFVWTPALLAALLAIPFLWRHDRVRAASAALYWAANTYVISCWWIWYYGSGFGSRVFIDHYPVLVLPLALVLGKASHRQWWWLRLFFVACIALHLAQYVQYRTNVLHHEDMDAERYRSTFLRFGPDHRDVVGGMMREPPYHPAGMDVVITESTDLERPSRYWQGGNVRHHPAAFSREHVCVYDAGSEFGITFRAPPGSLPPGRELFVQADLQRFEAKAGDALGALAVVAVVRPDSSIAFHISFPMEPLRGVRDSTWRPLSFRIPVPAVKGDEELRFYLWNKDHRARFLIDDVMLRVSAVRP